MITLIIAIIIYTSKTSNITIKGMNKYKAALANSTIKKSMTLEEVSKGADVLIGVSKGGAFNE